MALKRADIQEAIKQDIAGRGLDAADNDSAIEGRMDAFSIRLSGTDRQILERHFKRRGLKLTQGLRMVITDYMLENRLK